MKKLKRIGIILIIALLFNACGVATKPDKVEDSATTVFLSNIPEYSGEPYVILNDNKPDFTKEDLKPESYEYYAELDELGRCGVAKANISIDLMPTEDRGSIGQVKPSGWHTIKYDIVEGKYLYNRCHLIGFQLTGENANEKNLITGTRYMNTEGMLPFENMVADYIKETGNHVLYRVTPIFEGDCQVANGVQMEAKSVEDDGDGICFNVYVYNVQPGIEINYSTGDSNLAENTDEGTNSDIATFILNTNNKKFHRETCSSVADMKEENKQVYKGPRGILLAQRYEPCGRCNP